MERQKNNDMWKPESSSRWDTPRAMKHQTLFQIRQSWTGSLIELSRRTRTRCKATRNDVISTHHSSLAPNLELISTSPSLLNLSKPYLLVLRVRISKPTSSS